MFMSHRLMIPALFTGLLCMMAPVFGQAPAQGGTATPSDAQMRDLEQQIESMQQQLYELNTTRDPTARQRLMEQHWQGMQGYMGQMHDRWGMGYPWMMGRPWAMCGPGMMGGGRTSWPLPQGVTPDQYSEQMRTNMRQMQDQMSKIAQTTDQQERQRLMQEHWQTMYQHMQTMRGMDWMWGGGRMMGPGMMQGGMMPGAPAASAKPLPDADSMGAKLVSAYCIQCHAAPQPTLHTANEWTSVAQRMHLHMDSNLPGVKKPTDQDMQSIVAYMQRYARQ